MALGFKTGGVDLDTLFKVRSTTKRADIGLLKETVDVSNNFEKTGGGDLIASNTGFKSGGVDIKTLFRDITYGGALYATAATYTPSGGNIGGGPYSTAADAITAGGGAGGYTYAWARVSGDSTLSINSATSAAPYWTGSGTQGTSKSAVWRCTVTDAALATTTVDVTVTITFYAALSVPLDKSSVSGSGTGNGPFTTDAVTGTPTGGAGGYTYLWEYVSGDSLTVNTATAAATTFTGSDTAPGSLAAVYRLKVTDSLGNSGYSSNVSIALTFNAAGITVSLDKSTVYGERFGSGAATTDTVTATVSGGTGPYTYLWERLSGDASMSSTAPGAAASAFIRGGSPVHLYEATWRLRVTDSLGTIGYSDNVLAQVFIDTSA